MHFSSEQTSNVHNLTLKPSVLNFKKNCFKIALKLQVHSDFLNALYQHKKAEIFAGIVIFADFTLNVMKIKFLLNNSLSGENKKKISFKAYTNYGILQLLT